MRKPKQDASLLDAKNRWTGFVSDLRRGLPFQNKLNTTLTPRGSVVEVDRTRAGFDFMGSRGVPSARALCAKEFERGWEPMRWPGAGGEAQEAPSREEHVCKSEERRRAQRSQEP